MAANKVAIVYLAQGRLLIEAALLDEGTASAEFAARRRVSRIGNIALKDFAFRANSRVRNRYR